MESADPVALRSAIACKACNDDVSNEPRVKCAECRDLILCVGCFAQGAELEAHKRFHDYYSVAAEGMHFELLMSGWSTDEELLLLEGIEMYGLGNWREIAEHVRSKDRTQCATHYTNIYLSSACAPMPDISGELAPAGFQPAASEDPEQQEISCSPLVNTEPCRPLDTTAPGNDVSGFSNTAVASGAADAVRLEPRRLAKAVALESAGYMMRRGEFEDIPFETEAETCIADIMFTADDTPAQRDLKLSVLHAYNQKVMERERRVEIVLARGLLDMKKQRAWDRGLSKEERDTFIRARVYQRFFDDPVAHMDFVRALATERALRADIERLKGYRERGYKTWADLPLESRSRGDYRMPRFARRARDGMHRVVPSTAPTENISETSEIEQNLCSTLGLSQAQLQALLDFST